MKQTTGAEETLFSAVHPHLYKHISVYQILVSSLIALGGVAGIVLSMVLDESDTTLSMALLTVGIMFLLFALYRFFWKSYETVYRPTGSAVRTGSLYMDTAELERVQQMLKKNDFSDAARISFKEGGNGRLDYLVSKDGRFVAAQLFRFVPYTYEPASERYYYTDDAAAAVTRSISLKSN